MNLESIYKHFKKSDPTIFSHLVRVDFSEWLDSNKKHYSNNDYFVSLCHTIIGQQLSIKAASTIFNRFKKLAKNSKITPKKILSIPEKKLREAGLSWAKIKYVKDLAHKLHSNQLTLDQLHTKSDEEVIKHLTMVKGIGQWSAEMFLIFVLKRENVFSHGDLGLKKAMIRIYKLKKPSQSRFNKIVKNWHPFKTYGTIALWDSLEKSSS